ncbi:MAG: Brp/Blh family beta-carotene 15,15'-dioxygenase [Algoriphagus sp.]
MARIEFLVKGLGLTLGLAFLIFSDLPQTLHYILFGSTLLLVGIPHGGIDHLIHNPQIGKRGLVHFIFRYLLVMLGYGLLWWLLPLAALLAFLLMSSYHFGQSHFLDRLRNSSGEAWLYLIKGSFYLAILLFGDWEMTQKILQPILSLTLTELQRLGILGGLMASSLLIQGWVGRTFTAGDTMDYLILAPVLYFSPLLVGFSIYFGLWHSLPSMLAEYEYLKKYPAFSTPIKFCLQLLPFSGISLLGIALLLGVGIRYLPTQELYLVFFVMLSLISLPHILYMDTFLKEKVSIDS